MKIVDNLIAEIGDPQAEVMIGLMCSSGMLSMSLLGAAVFGERYINNTYPLASVLGVVVNIAFGVMAYRLLAGKYIPMYKRMVLGDPMLGVSA